MRDDIIAIIIIISIIAMFIIMYCVIEGIRIFPKKCEHDYEISEVNVYNAFEQYENTKVSMYCRKCGKLKRFNKYK